MNGENPDPQEIEPAELLSWIEFGFWSAAIIAPIVIWLQGESVSQDQFVVRTAMVVIAVSGAIGLRIAALVRKRREGKRGKSPE